MDKYGHNNWPLLCFLFPPMDPNVLTQTGFKLAAKNKMQGSDFSRTLQDYFGHFQGHFDSICSVCEKFLLMDKVSLCMLKYFNHVKSFSTVIFKDFPGLVAISAEIQALLSA